MTMPDGNKFGLGTSHLGLLFMVVRLLAMSSSRSWCVLWVRPGFETVLFSLIFRIICLFLFPISNPAKKWFWREQNFKITRRKLTNLFEMFFFRFLSKQTKFSLIPAYDRVNGETLPGLRVLGEIAGGLTVE